MNNLLWLEGWYERHAGNAPNSPRRILLRTLDSAGWSIQIDLIGTRYSEPANLELKQMTHSERDWMVCRIVNSSFEATGGPLMLGPMLQIFRNWVESFA